MDRNALLIGDATPATRIIEIGPSHAPIAPKRGGWNACVVDYYTRAELVEKFTGHPVDLDAIEEVDFNWRSGALDEAIPQERHATFDRMIASHVGEHVPDLIAFLASAQTLLTPQGVLALALPDKRFCADVLRPLTTTGDILVAHDGPATGIHSRRTMYNQVAYSVNMDGIPGWGQVPVHTLDFMNPLTDAIALYAASAAPGHPYVDCHAWQFTPASFELAILELSESGHIDWQISQCGPTVGSEFVILMRRGRKSWAKPAAREARRMELLLATMVEAREQIDFALRGKLITIPGLTADSIGGASELATKIDGNQRQLAFLRRQLDSITAEGGTQAAILGFLGQIATRQQDQQGEITFLRDQLDSITAAGGTQSSVLGFLEQIAIRQQDQQGEITFLRVQLGSITAAGGTQASIMGSLSQLTDRLNTLQRQVDTVVAADGTQASIMGFLEEVTIRLQDVQRQLDTIVAADGTQASIMGHLDQIALREHDLQQQLDSIVAADGTQASIMGSLDQLGNRQQELQRQLDTVVAADGTQASMMESLHQISIRQQDQQRQLDRFAVADSAQASILGVVKQIATQLQSPEGPFVPAVANEGTQAAILAQLEQIAARQPGTPHTADGAVTPDTGQAALLGFLGQIVSRQHIQQRHADRMHLAMVKSLADITSRLETQQQRLDEVHRVAHWVRRLAGPFLGLRARLSGRPKGE